MKFLKSAAVIALAFSPALADQVQFKIVDLLWLQHPAQGEGVEIVYQFDARPRDGNDALEAFALSECNRVAPKYVPIALEKVGRSDADFVAMNFRFGSAFGTCIKFFAKYKDGRCWDIE